MENMIIQVSAFNTKHFEIGEAVQIIEEGDNPFDALYVSGYKDRLRFVDIEWDSPMSGSADYRPKEFYIDVSDVVSGKTQIKKYKEKTKLEYNESDSIGGEYSV